MKSYPKIGIRPTIDGRQGGVRESLEEKTMALAKAVAGLGPVLQLAEGWTVELDSKTHDILDKRTDPTWPTTWFVPRLDASKDCFKDVYSVMNCWGANHGAIAYGHIGADYRACQNFGPIYK
jgi:L-fucose isomerase-like protein